jgi:hypothetical protein
MQKIWSLFLRFTVVYWLFLLLVPLLTDAYGSFFRSLSTAVLTRSDGPRELTFLPLALAGKQPQSRVEIVNRALMARDGSGKVRNMDYDQGSFLRILALFSALVLAQAATGPRRIRNLLLGWVLLHGFFLLILSFCIWNESRFVGLAPKLTPFWQNLADEFKHYLLSQLSLAVPVLLWLCLGWWDLRASTAPGRKAPPR